MSLRRFLHKIFLLVRGRRVVRWGRGKNFWDFREAKDGRHGVPTLVRKSDPPPPSDQRSFYVFIHRKVCLGEICMVCMSVYTMYLCLHTCACTHVHTCMHLYAFRYLHETFCLKKMQGYMWHLNETQETSSNEKIKNFFHETHTYKTRILAQGKKFFLLSLLVLMGRDMCKYMNWDAKLQYAHVRDPSEQESPSQKI